MSGPAALLANLGAEEGAAWPRQARLPAVRDAAALWALGFRAGTPRLDPAAAPGSVAAWLRDAAGAALEPLQGGDGALVAWLITPEAAELARERGLSLAGPDPQVVRRVHDKSFAVTHARDQGELEAACAVLEPGSPDAVAAEAEGRVAAWPAAWRARFVLKPRLGTSGRGRVPGRDGRVDREALRRAPAARGFVLEPWVERVADASTQLWIDASGRARILGQLWLDVTSDGLCTGFTAAERGDPGELDLLRAREAALRLARAAAREGYTGPCSVDALAWRDPGGRTQTRAVVELNARFSMGVAALGLFARARQAAIELPRPRLSRSPRPPEPGSLPVLGDYWLTPATGG